MKLCVSFVFMQAYLETCSQHDISDFAAQRHVSRHGVVDSAFIMPCPACLHDCCTPHHVLLMQMMLQWLSDALHVP